MQYIISIVTYIFDIFIINAFLKNILKNFKTDYRLHYCLALIFTEIILYINEGLISHNNSPLYMIITIVISMLTTFGLCFFYDCPIKSKIMTALSFQVLVSLGETFFTFIMSYVNSEIFETKDKSLLYSIMNIGSKTMLFLLCLFVVFLLRKQTDSRPIEYSILLFTTPIVTLIIFELVPLNGLYTVDSKLFYEILFLCLAILNIINYVLIQKAYDATIMQYDNKQMEQQLLFQKEKFEQLSESYRQSRRIIHDIKKHYFCIQEYVGNEQYDKLIDFTSEAVHDIESTYAKYNTGNLVIDSFLTNYENIAVKNNIAFSAGLNVDFNRVPINDYDLCVIIGNILDNSIKACETSNVSNSYIHIDIKTTDNDRFTIYCENTMSYDTAAKDNKSLNHGYGLSNIRNTVEKNHGFLTYSYDTIFRIDIMIPIIDSSKRVYFNSNF